MGPESQTAQTQRGLEPKGSESSNNFFHSTFKSGSLSKMANPNPIFWTGQIRPKKAIYTKSP